MGSCVYSKKHCGLQPWARAVCTFPAVLRPTQPSPLRGTVSEYQLSGWVAMVVVDASCLKQADSQPKSGGLVWGSAAAWRCSTFTKWTEWTLGWPCGQNDSTILISFWVLCIITLGAKLSGAVYCNRSCLYVGLFVCLFILGSVTTITRSCVWYFFSR